MCPWTHRRNVSLIGTGTRVHTSNQISRLFAKWTSCASVFVIIWTSQLLSISGRNWICGTGNFYLCPDLTAHSCSSHIKPVHSAMGSEEITLAWLQRHALSHFPIRAGRMRRQCSLCDLETTVLRIHTQTHAHTHQLTRYQKSPPCVSVPPGCCFLRRLQRQWASLFSAAHVERWYVSMLNRTPQRIPN